MEGSMRSGFLSNHFEAVDFYLFDNHVATTFYKSTSMTRYNEFIRIKTIL